MFAENASDVWNEISPIPDLPFDFGCENQLTNDYQSIPSKFNEFSKEILSLHNQNPANDFLFQTPMFDYISNQWNENKEKFNKKVNSIFAQFFFNLDEQQIAQVFEKIEVSPEWFCLFRFLSILPRICVEQYLELVECIQPYHRYDERVLKIVQPAISKMGNVVRYNYLPDWRDLKAFAEEEIDEENLAKISTLLYNLGICGVETEEIPFQLPELFRIAEDFEIICAEIQKRLASINPNQFNNESNMEYVRKTAIHGKDQLFSTIASRLLDYDRQSIRYCEIENYTLADIQNLIEQILEIKSSNEIYYVIDFQLGISTKSLNDELQNLKLIQKPISIIVSNLGFASPNYLTLILKELFYLEWYRLIFISNNCDIGFGNQLVKRITEKRGELFEICKYSLNRDILNARLQETTNITLSNPKYYIESKIPKFFVQYTIGELDFQRTAMLRTKPEFLNNMIRKYVEYNDNEIRSVFLTDRFFEQKEIEKKILEYIEKEQKQIISWKRWFKDFGNTLYCIEDYNEIGDNGQKVFAVRGKSRTLEYDCHLEGRISENEIISWYVSLIDNWVESVEIIFFYTTSQITKNLIYRLSLICKKVVFITDEKNFNYLN